jgi:hypothetical protein
MGLQALLCEAEAAPMCAHCRVEMIAVYVRTFQFSDGQEDVTYRCEECGAQQIRTSKPAWSA